ncbi:MAG: CD0415/CD1112 family protein [Christensenellales bacterium]|nr:CD0415/CD1112 family protein [Christensenellales bacterium]
MNFLWDKVTEWLKELLIGSIMSNLTGLFDNVNRQVAGIADNVGATPQAWNGGVFGMIRNLSDNVILPIAGVILALVATLELIQMIVDRNNMHDMDTFMLAKWVFKTACAVVIVTNTWNIVMAVFDVAQSVVSRASGLVIADTDIRIDSVIVGLEAKLAEMELGALFGLWVQSMFVGFTMWALAICIFIITYGRMIEIYLVTSVAPIPMATMANREWGQMGQNYLRSLFALGFQAFLIIICVVIYAILVRGIAVESDVSTAIWTCMGYTVLLCFTLFKTSSLARSIFHAH